MNSSDDLGFHDALLGFIAYLLRMTISDQVNFSRSILYVCRLLSTFTSDISLQLNPTITSISEFELTFVDYVEDTEWNALGTTLSDFTMEHHDQPPLLSPQPDSYYTALTANSEVPPLFSEVKPDPVTCPTEGIDFVDHFDQFCTDILLMEGDQLALKTELVDGNCSVEQQFDVLKTMHRPATTTTVIYPPPPPPPPRPNTLTLDPTGGFTTTSSTTTWADLVVDENIEWLSPSFDDSTATTPGSSSMNSDTFPVIDCDDVARALSAVSTNNHNSNSETSSRRKHKRSSHDGCHGDRDTGGEVVFIDQTKQRDPRYASKRQRNNVAVQRCRQKLRQRESEIETGLEKATAENRSLAEQMRLAMYELKMLRELFVSSRIPVPAELSATLARRDEGRSSNSSPKKRQKRADAMLEEVVEDDLVDFDAAIF